MTDFIEKLRLHLQGLTSVPVLYVDNGGDNVTLKQLSMDMQDSSDTERWIIEISLYRKPSKTMNFGQFRDESRELYEVLNQDAYHELQYRIDGKDYSVDVAGINDLEGWNLNTTVDRRFASHFVFEILRNKEEIQE